MFAQSEKSIQSFQASTGMSECFKDFLQVPAKSIDYKGVKQFLKGMTMEISKHGKHVTAPPHFQIPVPNTESGELKSANVGAKDETQSQRLLSKLQGDAEVRNRLLVEVQAKFQAGEYATRSAIEKAAQQILGL